MYIKTVDIEKPLAAVGVPTEKPGGKMDIVFMSCDTPTTLVDTVVSHPTAASYVRQTAAGNDATNTTAERGKNRKYGDKVRARCGKRSVTTLVTRTQCAWICVLFPVRPIFR